MAASDIELAVGRIQAALTSPGRNPVSTNQLAGFITDLQAASLGGIAPSIAPNTNLTNDDVARYIIQFGQALAALAKQQEQASQQQPQGGGSPTIGKGKGSDGTIIDQGFSPAKGKGRQVI